MTDTTVLTSSVTSQSTATNTSWVPFAGPPEMIAYAATVMFLFVVGFVGNVITITTIITSSSLKSAWYQLITSLALSDLVSAVASPLFMYNLTWGFEIWRWPKVLCKMTFGLDIFTSYVTTMHILWFSILRFISLQWPHKFKPFAEKHGKRSIFVIWIVAFLVGFIPFFLFMEVYDRDRTLPNILSKWAHCSVGLSWFEAAAWYTRIAYPLFYYIPFVLIIFFSVGIGVKVFSMRKKRNAKRKPDNVNETEMNRRKKENQIILQLILIVGTFMFGYFPTTAFMFFVMGATYTPDRSYWIMTWRFSVTAHVLLRLSECLNPIFYNLSSSEMRKETFATLKKMSLKPVCCGQNQ